MPHRPTILVTGAHGQIGYELVRLLAPHGDVVAADRGMLDLADPDAIVAVVRGTKPALIVNAGAYTAVDRAETEVAPAHAVNGRAPGILAEEAKRLGAVLIHYSTDYVFDGTRATPYPEDAPPAPLNVYGASKLEGERAIAAAGAHALVLRTSWVYGLRGGNFLLTIRRLAAERDELRIVADQIGVPNWSRTLAAATARIVGAGLPTAVGAGGALSPVVHGAGKLVRLRARHRRRCAAAARRAIDDGRISDAGTPAGVWRPRDRPLRADVRFRACRIGGTRWRIASRVRRGDAGLTRQPCLPRHRPGRVGAVRTRSGPRRPRRRTARDLRRRR